MMSKRGEGGGDGGEGVSDPILKVGGGGTSYFTSFTGGA